MESVIDLELAQKVERLHALRRQIKTLTDEEDKVKKDLSATLETEIEGVNVKAAISYIAESKAVDNAALVKFLAPKESVVAKFMKTKAAYALIRIVPL